MEPGKQIVNYPHPALRHPASPVTSIDKSLRLYAGRMLELMYGREGLGLAGPQVGLPLQILVMNFTADPEDKANECVAINPVILERKGVQEGNEGCLSFPDLYQKVRRAKTVLVRAFNLEGQQFEMTCSDLPARLWQHEVDHLHGKLFIDLMSPLGKMSSRSALKKFEDEYRALQKRGDIPADDAIRKHLHTFRQEPEPHAGPVL